MERRSGKGDQQGGWREGEERGTNKGVGEKERKGGATRCIVPISTRSRRGVRLAVGPYVVLRELLDDGVVSICGIVGEVGRPPSRLSVLPSSQQSDMSREPARVLALPAL